MQHHFLWLATVLATLPCAALAHEAPVQGLIVQLKDAPVHHGLQKSAQAGQADRWQRLLRDAGIEKDAPRLQPNGRSAQLLRFARPLEAAEAERMAERLRADPAVKWVTPNVREQLLAGPPNDPFYVSGQQWWLVSDGGSNQNSAAMRLRGVPDFLNAWQHTAGSSAVPVAVLDTGITFHPELTGHLLPGFDFVSEVEHAADGDGRDNDPSDPGDGIGPADRSQPALANCADAASSWHGTIIAGLIGAATDNSEGVAAIHRDARIVPVRVAGKCGAELADIVEGMRWAAGLPACKVDDGRGTCTQFAPANPNPARIVNISFGGSAVCGAAYQQAIDDLRAAGVVVVAAAGNGHGAPTRPASCRDTVGVTALNRDGFKAHYSDFGPEIDIATVGGDNDGGAWGPQLADSGLLTVFNLGTGAPGAAAYASLFGTSFSAPLVSGTLALMLSINPGLTWDQLVDGLRRSARPHVVSPKIGACSADNPGRCICTTTTCGAGILDAEQAVLYAMSPDTYVAPAAGPQVIDNADIDAALALSPQDLPSNVAPASGGGGGGAMGFGWLAALLCASGLLFGARRR